MTTATTIKADPGRPTAKRRRPAGLLRRALRTWRGRIGAAVTLLVVAIAYLGPLLASDSGVEFSTAPYAPPGPGHPLGGDVLGHDLLSRLLHGGHTLLTLSILATALGLVLGAVAGVWAAYRGGWVDAVVMRVVDIILAIPSLVFALLLVSVIGPKLWLVVLAVGLSHAPQVARVVYGAAQDLVERDFVKAVALWGVPDRRIIRREILPNLATPLLVEAGLRLSYSIIIIAGLSFLGFGVQPPTPDWGVMINENRLGLAVNSWGVVAPAVLVALLAVGTNTLADAIARVGLGEEHAEELLVADARGGAEK